MKVLFFGTPQFSVPTLEKLARERFQIDLVMTNPDEPRGRGYELQAAPVKQAAERLGLPVYQPTKLKDPAVQSHLSRFTPDAAVVVAYGHLLPAWLLEIPKLGCINLHASLLPKYRGAAPIPWAIIQGERTTGVTTMKIDAGMDTGDILLVRETPILESDTRASLEARLSVMGADLIVETLRGFEQGALAPRPQDHLRATLAPMLKKADGRLDWNLTAAEIERRVRGFDPWPGAYSTFRGKTIHIRAARVADRPPTDSAAPGKLIVQDGKLLVVCGGGAMIEAIELQPEGRKRMTSQEFLNGARLKAMERFGT